MSRKFAYCADFKGHEDIELVGNVNSWVITGQMTQLRLRIDKCNDESNKKNGVASVKCSSDSEINKWLKNKIPTLIF